MANNTFDEESDSDHARNARVSDKNHLHDPKTQSSSLPANSWHTQPTQILQTPQKPSTNGHILAQHSSPAVQVAASSPPATRSPQVASNGNSNGRAHSMAPPGTAFRHPSQHAASQMQSQTQPMDLDVGMISDSSDEMKPAYFEKGGYANGASRIADSPHAKFKSNISQFAHNPSTKRAAPDDLISSYAFSTSSKKPRTEGPSRSIQEADIKLEDIPDWAMRKNVERLQDIFPHATNRQAYESLKKKRGHYEDALSHLSAVLNNELSSQDVISVHDSSSDSASAPKPQAKQTVAKTGKISERYGSKAQAQSRRPPQLSQTGLPSPVLPKKKGRLIRGPRAQPKSPSPDPLQAHSSPLPAEPKQRRRAVESGSESGSETAASTENEADDETGSGDSNLEAQLLELLNGAKLSALLDLSGASKEDVTPLMTARPFKNLDVARAVCKELPAKGKRKPRQANIGDKIVNSCLDILEGYNSLNKLVSTCEERGRPVLAQMRAWGLANFGESAGGELEMTSLQAQKGYSGHQLPQPTNMSEDLTMKDYQLAGLNWLDLLYKHGLSAILADDMGLGKTCQVIAFLAQLQLNAQKEERSSDFTIVVVPGSTLENWLREIKNFCPGLTFLPYYGTQKDRYESQVNIKEMVENKELNVVVTTYDMATKKQDASFLRSLKPDICVYDEAHHLKNSTTTRYQQLMQIRVRKMRILLTGTPLQNNLVELSSLLGFLMPDIFEEHRENLQSVFSARAKVNTSQGQDDDNDEGEQHDELLSRERIGRARRMLTPFILRRKKDQVLKQLPAKTNSVEYFQLSGTHKMVYDDALAAYSRHGGDDAGKMAMKSSLINLRKAAIHPLLFRRHYEDKAVERIARHHNDLDYPPSVTPKAEYQKRYQQYLDYYTEMSDFEIHSALGALPKLKSLKLKGEPWLDSDKVQALLVLLDKHASEGHTTLVFSQFTSVMDILEAVFQTKNIPFYRLDGQTDMNTRQDLIDDFSAASTSDAKSRKPVFMLSTRAGGQGINLTVADRVVIFDSGFNPQDDVQAENRAHRVGQTRPVEVVRLVARGTVEEAILTLGQRKLKLDALVAGAADGEAEGAAMVGRLLEEKCKVEVDDEMTDMNKSENTKNGKMEVEDEKVEQQPDVGRSFMKGLKDAGLDMNAAALAPLKR